MSLSADIQNHRDQIISELGSIHDYYVNTKRAWRAVQRAIARGERLRIRNVVTGNVTDERELSAKAQLYVTEYLAAATFQQFISLFEDFMFGLMRQWLLAFPMSLGKAQIPVSVVFSAPDLNAVKLAAVNRRLHDLSHERVRDWFAALEQMVKLGCPTDDEIDSLAEVKASRDIVVHNRGIANTIYEEKAGKLRRHVAGEKLGIPDSYHRESWELIRKVVIDMSSAAIAKAP